MIRLILLVCLAAFVAGKTGRYAGQRLVSVTPKNHRQLDVLVDLLAAGEPWLDFWNAPGVNRTASIRVPEAGYDVLSQRAKAVDMKLDLLSDDVEMFLERTRQPVNGPHPKLSPFSAWQGGFLTHNSYRRYGEFIDIMDGMVQNVPNLVKSRGILSRLTYEEREVHYIRLGAGTNKPVVFIEGLIHAREWIVGGVVLYFMDRLVSRYGTDPDATFLLDNYDFFIVPVLNPDGYEYSHTTDRFWRKNRSYISNICRGVDLNRNFAADWGNAGVSTNCRSDVYCGPQVWSEQESLMIYDAVTSINAEPNSFVLSYLAVHSYSELLLTPYSYDYVRPPNRVEIDNVAEQMTLAMIAPFNTNYEWGHGPPLLYPVSGASDDWAILNGGVRFSYTYELRPKTSTPGFDLHESNIIPNGFEFWESIVAMGCTMDVGAPPCTFRRSTR